jgi:hypothetical protein
MTTRPSDLEQARRGLRHAQREFVGERSRLERAREQLRQDEEQVARKQRRLKRQKRHLKHAVRVYLLHRMPEQSVCAEIGVHEGEFAWQILDVAAPKRLHLIDPWKHMEEYSRSLFGGKGADGQRHLDERYERVKERLTPEIAECQVQVHRAFSASASEYFDDSYFDWIYVDGNHTYEFVRQDLELYYPKVKAGGFMIGDDYGVKGWWNNGVQKAVDEFVGMRPGTSLEVLHTQFVIRVP